MTKIRTWHGTDYNATVDPTLASASNHASRILVIDDNARMRQSIKDLLDAYDFECLTAQGGRIGLNLLEKETVDLILLDLKMPDMDGYQVLDRLAERNPDVDVIVISGESSFESATRTLRQGALDFLRKPYSPDELIRSVRGALDKRQMRRQMHRIHQHLQVSEQRHRFIVNNSPDIIYMLDELGRFSFINERVQSLLGYSPDEVIGCHYTDFIFDQDQTQAKYAFSERRTGERASHNVQFRLNTKTPQQRRNQPHVTIELSAMGVYAHQPETENRNFVGTYGVARDISERKQAEELIHFQLHHDLLTKLPNRALFRDRLELAIAQALRNKQRLAVMYLDMDRFKVINDSLGHLVGDQLLQAVASRLRQCLRDSDTLARVGGDEFNLLLPEIGSKKDAAKIAAKILQTLEQPLVLEGIEIFVSFSIGIALYPDDGSTMETLIKHADTAMYHVKGRGKKAYEFYSQDMKNQHSRHLAMESGLRKALDENQLRIFFQPQMNTQGNQVKGVEALLRWEHPEEGMILPAEFIPLCEETGIIIAMGRWMLDNACAILSQWTDRGLQEITLAINVSARELMQADFSDFVLDTLAKHDVPGHQLELEITENVLMQDMDQAVTKLKQLAEQGVRIAVDDFGTGYSSLSYLQTLPLNTLKVDRTFISKIQTPDDKSAIVTAIVAMANGLGLDLVAEGVESPIQLDYLRKLGCPTVQGFLVGHPSPAQDLMSKIHQIGK